MTYRNGQFTWWHVVDGVAVAVDGGDPAVCDAIDDGRMRNVYMTIEGAILHGGVLATAFERETNQTYDAAAWLATGAMVPVGSVTTTKITASRET
jgi:hypothetical protein